MSLAAPRLGDLAAKSESLRFFESHPAQEIKFEEVVEQAKQAAVLVLVY
jgi:hypothetical protein